MDMSWLLKYFSSVQQVQQQSDQQVKSLCLHNMAASACSGPRIQYLIHLLHYNHNQNATV